MTVTTRSGHAHPQPAPARTLHDRFPTDFVWGVATAAFQIEGAAQLDGKGESIWDRFCRTPGVIADGSNGDVACDHYHRLDEDIDLIASLGVKAYRFSMSWPRVLPSGQGLANPKGLAFYDRMIDALLARGIKPYLTLNHWDLPQALQDQGGWLNRDTIDRFTEYALLVNRHVGDRLHALTTHNEPWVIAVLGHEQGIFAPGIKSRATAMQVAHHLLVSHGQALQALRADGASARLGIVLNMGHSEPATDTPADRRAAALDDARNLRWYMDPLFGRGYPPEILAELGADAPRMSSGDMATIATPIDYLGINYYTRSVSSAAGPFDVTRSGLPLTDMGWEIYPQGLTMLLERLHRDYPLPPIYITENGAAFHDVRVGTRVHDHLRIEYLQSHISAVADAIDKGVPMAGYMVWSLLDNFEWASGYAKRFGIVHVDYESQARALKDSGRWYREFLAAFAARVAVRGSGS